MRPSLRASWRAHPPRSPPGGGKNHYWTMIWNVLTCICHYGDDSTPEKEQIHIVPEENDVPPFLILVAKLFPVLLAVFFPTIGVPDGDHGYAHPYLFTYSLILHINDFKLTRMFQTKLSNLVFCTNQDNINDKTSPTGLVVLALCIWLTHNQANRWICKRSSFSKNTFVCPFQKKSNVTPVSERFYFIIASNNFLF